MNDPKKNPQKPPANTKPDPNEHLSLGKILLLLALMIGDIIYAVYAMHYFSHFFGG